MNHSKTTYARSLIYGAKILSRIFTPFSVPLLSFVALFLFTHLNLTFSTRNTLAILDIIFRFTIAMPTISIFFIHKLSHISFMNQTPYERNISAFMVSTLCFLFSFIVFTEMGISLTSKYLLSLTAVFGFFLLIQLKWRLTIRTSGLIRKNTGVLSELNEREHRYMPLFLTIASYLICALIMFKRDLPWYMNGIILASLLILIIHTLINYRWRVSEHMAAIGGIMGGIISFSALFLYDPIIWICLFIFIAGALGASRIILGHNNLGEILAGFLIGLSCTLIALDNSCNHIISSIFTYLI